MKILLINPPRSPHNDILKYAPDEAKPFIHRRLIGPPLGLLTIASSVPGHDVFLFDMKGEYDLDPETPALRRPYEETDGRTPARHGRCNGQDLRV